MSFIQILPPLLANQIAAGEVVERPASVVKELLENSLDAAATQLSVCIEEAGKRLIEVEDNGLGMDAEDAVLALKRHATSKITTIDDLHAIASHGFRGEALPSIASVSRLLLETCPQHASEGVSLRVEAGEICAQKPLPVRQGTRIRVHDLFYNTPARRRFMRSDRSEDAAIVEVVRGLALSSPEVGFCLKMNGRVRFQLEAGQDRAQRVRSLLGDELSDNARLQDLLYEGITVEGVFAYPTHHYRDSTRMHFLLNGRMIRDKALAAVLRVAYRDVMFHDRYPQAVVWLELDPALVDVNVHPSKREVRFSKPADVHAALLACARTAIEHMGQQVSSMTTAKALQSMQPAEPSSHAQPAQTTIKETEYRAAPVDASMYASIGKTAVAMTAEPMALHQPVLDASFEPEGLFLGEPLAQIHGCFLISQTRDGVVLVDQHAAAERIAYERLKAQLLAKKVARQSLLLPISWQPSLEFAAYLHDQAETLLDFGFELQATDADDVFQICSVPAVLIREHPVHILEELLASLQLISLAEQGHGRVLERWLGNYACRHSIKSGKPLNLDQQRVLLREMEQTPNIAQCNHGRPTYVRLSLSDLERLFGRRE